MREIRARFSKGRIEPLEEIDLRDGDEITITIQQELTPASARKSLATAAGAWKGTLDFEAYLKDLSAARRQPSRWSDREWPSIASA